MRAARRVLCLAAAAAFVATCGCGDDATAPPDGDAGTDDAPGDAGDLGLDDAPVEAEPDARPDVPLDGWEEDAAGDAPAETTDAEDAVDARPPYERGSLAGCLLDPSCDRVLVNSHMGAWTATIPGNSMAAYRRAWELGADMIEADVRVSRDGVPFMIHNDEIQYYESLLCAGRVVSESDAAEIDGCLLAPSLTETIPTFAEFVEWARGKILIHLDIKEAAHIPVMAQAVIDHAAQDYVFLALSPGEAQTIWPTVPGHDEVHFEIRVGSVADIDAALGPLRHPTLFLLEGDATWDGVDETAMRAQVARVHAAGLRIMASSDTYLATVENHLHLYDMGFDVILSYDCENGVAAAREVNRARGWPP